MSYYIKISYNSKMKKFIVRNPKQISIQQIKNTFNPPIASNLNLSFVVKYKTEEPKIISCESELIDYFINRQFATNETVRLDIIQIQQKNKESVEDQQFYQQFVENNRVFKIRSHSEELDSCLITNEFNIKSAEDFLYRSMKQSSSQMKQAEQFIDRKSQQLDNLKLAKRETNILDLIQFLHRRKS